MIFLNEKLNKLFVKYIFSSRKKLYSRLNKLEKKFWIWIHTVTWNFLFLKCPWSIVLTIWWYWKNWNSWEYMLISFRWIDWKEYSIDFEIFNWKEIKILDDSNIWLLEKSFLYIINNTNKWK